MFKKKKPGASKERDVAKMRDAGDVDGLLTVLKAKGDLKARGAAIQALGDIGDERAVEPLIEGIQGVMQVLGNMIPVVREGPQPPDMLDTLMGANIYVELANETVEALGKIGDARAIPFLQEVIDDETLREAMGMDVAPFLSGADRLTPEEKMRSVEVVTGLLLLQAARLRENSAKALELIGGTPGP